MKNYIIITSIFEPTEAVKKFASLENYQLIVVGDKKSPQDWKYKNVDYLSVQQQQDIDSEFVKNLPYNHYCRKMIGYHRAIKDGATSIIDTDDDNIPKSDWNFPDFDTSHLCTIPNKGFVNIYQYFTDQHIWPRGLPLSDIKKTFAFDDIQTQPCKIGVWQGLADEDPDVDAIYRLTNDTPCNFHTKPPIVLSEGTLCPFNSQNTKIRKELFALLYLPVHVTFRFTDILRGLIAQPIMHLYGYQLGFTKATVIQKRNPHDYMKDFISEIPMYQYTSEVINIVQKVITANDNIEDNLYNAYDALAQHDIVTKEEVKILTLWLKAIS